MNMYSSKNILNSKRQKHQCISVWAGIYICTFQIIYAYTHMSTQLDPNTIMFTLLTSSNGKMLSHAQM